MATRSSPQSSSLVLLWGKVGYKCEELFKKKSSEQKSEVNATAPRMQKMLTQTRNALTDSLALI